MRCNKTRICKMYREQEIRNKTLNFILGNYWKSKIPTLFSFIFMREL